VEILEFVIYVRLRPFYSEFSRTRGRGFFIRERAFYNSNLLCAASVRQGTKSFVK
jgi:hypothetical protein